MKYGVYLSTIIKSEKLKNGSGIKVLEPNDYSSKEIKAIKAKGYKVLGYLSVGTNEKERPWFNKYKDCRLKRLEDWPNEWYADVREEKWQKFLLLRGQGIINKGFDGLWCDNLDVYEYCKSDAMFKACKKVLKELKKKYGYIMVNGGAEFFDKCIDKKVDITKLVDGVTQEEVFSRIKDYSDKGKFGEQESDQKKFYKSYMKRLAKAGVQTFLLEYTRSDVVKKKIKDFCKKYKMTGYYISKDVNL